MNRALNCTREMAVKHLDELAEELISAKIMTNHQKVAPGIWDGQIDLSRYEDLVYLKLSCEV